MVTTSPTVARLPQPGELTADSEAGAALIAAVGLAADDFASAALALDRDGTFAVEHLQRLRAEGVLVATIPTDVGGGGVGSTRDLLVATSRLARTDPATTIGVNMHFAVVGNVVRARSVAAARGDERTAERLGDVLRMVVATGTIFASAVSEPGPQDLTRPATTATATLDGWSITGRKAFATMAAHATVLSVGVTFVDRHGRDRYGFALVPRDTPGITFHDDWDALGMRSSASGSVSFRDVRIGVAMLSDCAEAGAWSAGLMDRYVVSGALHASASLGIAEQAQMHAVTRLRRDASRAAGDPHVISALAANAADLAAMRAALERSGRVIDGYHAAHPVGEATVAEAQAVTAEVQATKSFLNDAAIRVVDRSLALVGGAAYGAGHPLAKAWRDVRAGPFMHPIGANRVGRLLARAELGLEPA